MSIRQCAAQRLLLGTRGCSTRRCGTGDIRNRTQHLKNSSRVPDSAHNSYAYAIASHRRKPLPRVEHAQLVEDGLSAGTALLKKKSLPTRQQVGAFRDRYIFANHGYFFSLVKG